MADSKRLFDGVDAALNALYAKRSVSDNDVWPLLVDANGYLLMNMTVGSVSLSTTATTVTNAPGNPVNVALSSTAVTASLSSTLVTVAPQAGSSLATTGVTVTNAAANPAQVALTETRVTAHISTSASVVTVHISPSASAVTASLSSTIVTIAPQAGSTLSTTTRTVHFSNTASVVTAHISPSASAVTASLSSTLVTVAPQAGSSLATTGVTVSLGRTLTSSSGSLSATIGSVTITPTNGAKIYGYSLTTTSATEVICIFYDGGFSTAKELWRVSLMAPSGANSGANFAVSPPGWLFKSRSASSVNLSLSTAALVHYSISWFDEA